MVLTQYDWRPYRKRIVKPTETPRRECTEGRKTVCGRGTERPSVSSGEGFQRKPRRWHLDLDFKPIKWLENKSLLFKPSTLWCLVTIV